MLSKTVESSILFKLALKFSNANFNSSRLTQPLL